VPGELISLRAMRRYCRTSCRLPADLTGYADCFGKPKIPPNPNALIWRLRKDSDDRSGCRVRFRCSGNTPCWFPQIQRTLCRLVICSPVLGVSKGIHFVWVLFVSGVRRIAVTLSGYGEVNQKVQRFSSFNRKALSHLRMNARD